MKLVIISCFWFAYLGLVSRSREPEYHLMPVIQFPLVEKKLEEVIPEETHPEVEPQIEEKAIEPEFNKWPKVRNISDTTLGVILTDIESHMPAGHIYRDSSKMTWAHETTHGLNSNIRNKHPDSSKVNGFYCLEDRSCIIYEPKTTIRKIAPLVPSALRGPSYNLYLVQQTSGWNDRPLYIFDEWIAYTNGSLCGKEMNVNGWYYELLQAHNFNVYSICLAMQVKKECSDYNDAQMKAFMMWNIERTFKLLATTAAEDEIIKALEITRKQNPGLYGDDKNPTANALEYVRKLRSDASAEEIRKFSREYFGAEWCKRVMGF